MKHGALELCATCCMGLCPVFERESDPQSLRRSLYSTPPATHCCSKTWRGGVGCLGKNGRGNLSQGRRGGEGLKSFSRFLLGLS